MLDPILRRLKDRLLLPLARAVPGSIHPTAVTGLGALLGMAAAVAAASGWLALGLALWLANRVVDGLDGLIARVRGRQTALGGYLDLLLDFVVYAAVPVGLAWADGRPQTSWALIFLLAMFYVNSAGWLYLSAVLERRGDGAAARGEPTTVTFPTGLIGGSETILAYTLFFLVPGWLPWWFFGFGALVGFTVMQRVWWAWRHL